MSYADVIAGLRERFETVPGIKVILDYEPPSIQVYPTLYSMPSSGTRSFTAQETVMTYETLHRLVFRWQDQKTAFSELWPFINSIPNAVELDRHLGNRVLNGQVSMTRYETNFITIGGTEYLCLDWYSSVEYKGKSPRLGGTI